MKRSKHVFGVSLPELLVAFFISSFFMIGMITQFSLLKRGYKLFEEKERLQEEHYLLSTLFREKMMGAGFLGCTNIKLSRGESGTAIYKGRDKRLPLAIQKRVKIDSDVLLLTQLSSSHTALSEKMNSRNSRKIQTVLKLKKGSELLLSDCRHSSVLRLKRIDKKNIILYFQYPSDALYDKSAQIGQYMKTFFYIAKKGKKTGLYIKEGDARSEEISNQVIDMHLLKNRFSRHNLLKVTLTFIDKGMLDIDVALRNE